MSAPHESNGQCAQNARRKTEPSQGEATGIRSAGPADTEQSEASRAFLCPRPGCPHVGRIDFNIGNPCRCVRRQDE